MTATAASLPASVGRESARASTSSGAAPSPPSSVVPKAEQTDAWPSGGGADEAAPGAAAAHDGPIRAYAKLEFPGFSYYVQTLQVTIGRRPGQLQGAHAAPVRAPTPAARHGDVDVDLGPLKSISRLHARIFYSTQPQAYRHRTHLSPMLAPGAAAPDARDGTSDAAAPGADEGRFLLEVLGRNGAFVDDVWVRMNGVAPLGRRTKIQIAERVFYFVLPPPAPVDDDDAASASGSESGVALSDDDSAASSELSDVEHDEAPAPAPTSPAAPKLVLKARAKLSPPRKEAHKRVHDASPDDAHAKRRRAAPAEAAAPLPVGTPIASRRSSRRAARARARARARRRRPTRRTRRPRRRRRRRRRRPSAEAPAAGAFQKPELSNVELITNALRSDACLRKGHKLTLQEVYEWLQHTYPWFAQNGRKTGRDWQSSIRHTIGTSREFVKIPRRADEHGKGIFYTLATSDVAQAHEAARRAAPAASPLAADAPPAASPPAAPAPPAPHTPAAAEAPAPRIPLVVGVPPGAEAARAPRGKNVPGSIESLLDTPPIAHHQGKLYLSPKVFGHLAPEQLRHIEGLGAQQALQVLQAYLVSHLKERMKKPDAKAPSKAPDGGRSPGAPTPAPAPPAATSPPAAPAPAAPAPAPAPAPADNLYDQRLEAPKVPRIPVASPAPAAPAARSSIPPAAPPSASPPPAAPAAPAAAPRASPAAASIPPSASRAPDAANPLAALSALAAHPEAAGLMALLQKQQSGAGGGTVKLTPKQLELLQLANQLAMQKKKKKAASAQAPDARAPTPGAATTSTSAAQSPPPPQPPPP
ncbi:FHL1 [Malassezia furfur]|nr:FHL1 [Malassezia furfur]